MEIPGLGKVTAEPDLDWYVSEPIAVPVLGGTECRIAVEYYDDDPDPEAIHRAIQNFLAAAPEVLRAAEPHLFHYYRDCAEYAPDIRIESPEGVWPHIHFGDQPIVSRRGYGDERVYVSVECGCDWEDEHGLQIVFEEGARVSKIGPFDGHLTNEDAYADPRLAGVIYRGT
jgi:hypothetical protein